MTLLLIGARQARSAGALDRDHSVLYDEGRVVELDPATGRATVRLRYRTPETVWCGPRAGRALKGATWDGTELLLCAERELVWVDPDTWAVTARWSHPWLNDVHHAVRDGERLLVASTGSDCVLEVRGGEVRAVMPVMDGVPSPRGELRTRDLRPHLAHPNHVFRAFGQWWVTRAHHRDAVRLDGSARLPVDQERVHDGVEHGGAAWLTTVDGHLVATTPDGVRACIRVAPETEGPLGWCRGLWLAQDGSAWVGFTRLRATRFRAHLAWARGRLRGAQHHTALPSRVAHVEVSTGRVLAEHPVEDLGLDALFAVVSRDVP